MVLATPLQQRRIQVARFYYKIARATHRATIPCIFVLSANWNLTLAKIDQLPAVVVNIEAAAAKNAQSSTGESKDRQSFETLVAVRLTNLINL